MNAYVVDTNVAVVANGTAPHASAECVRACLVALRDAIAGIFVLDSGGDILAEYMKNLSFSGQPGAGDAFFKFVFDNQARDDHCEVVTITKRNDSPDDYVEFPDDSELAAFDKSDRKFVAVAIASTKSPSILNAVDSDWWEFQTPLTRHGILIKFVCPDQFRQ